MSHERVDVVLRLDAPAKVALIKKYLSGPMSYKAEKCSETTLFAGEKNPLKPFDFSCLSLGMCPNYSYLRRENCAAFYIFALSMVNGGKSDIDRFLFYTASNFDKQY